jgi:hypothetical protein
MSTKNALRTPKRSFASFAKYEPAIAKFGKALRAKLRIGCPVVRDVRGENQNSLGSRIHRLNGYDGPDPVYPSCVKLFFGHGAQLSKSDPNKLP